MFEKYKEEFMQRPKTFIIVFIILFGLCIYMLRDYITEIWPGEKEFNVAIKKLQKSQLKLRNALNEKYRLSRHRESFIKNSADFWLTKRDGDAALNIQKKINKEAEKSSVVLSSVGAVKTEEISDGVSLLSVSIRSKAPLKSIVEFIAELEKMQPRPYWKTLVLRPDNPKQPVNTVLSGSIQFISITDKEAVKLLLEKKASL